MGSVPLALYALLMGVAGCGDPQAGETTPDAPKAATHPVKGKIVLGDGKPLTEGVVSFMPVKQPARGASGKVQSDGSFELETPGVGPGAAEGEYTVSIQSSQKVAAPKGGEKPAVPSIYSVDDTTPIRLTIKSGNNDLKPIQLREGRAGLGKASASSNPDDR